MAGCGIPHVDALARAVRGLAAYRRWTRDRALARQAAASDLAEYVRVTSRLLELDQQYWHDVAVANATLVEARRGSLSLHERQAITERLLTAFQAVYRRFEERVGP